MKTTSYEISKKLWEIGFKKDTIYCWDDENTPSMFSNGVAYAIIKPSKTIMKSYLWFPAYDLETILDALPHDVETTRGLAYFVMRKNSILYEREGEEEFPEIVLGKLKNELNWADTAALLLIKLYEKGLIKF